MTTARAGVLEAPGAPFVLQEYPVRDPGPGEALVRVRLATICRSDIHTWAGRRPGPLPTILGHEIIGTVAALGPRMERDLRGEPLAIGDPVTWTLCVSCGDCHYCRDRALPQKCVSLRKYGHERAAEPPHLLGGFAEYCHLLPGTGVVRLPSSLADEEAVPLNCGGATMVAAVEAAGIGPGDTVVVLGLGLLGLYAVALARARGAGRVIALDALASRRALGTRFTADAVLNPVALGPDGSVARVRALAPPDGADAVIEAAGDPALVPLGLRMLRMGGRAVVAGLVFPGAALAFDGELLVRHALTLRGVHNYLPRHLVEAVDFATKHRACLPLRELVETRFPLDRLDEAFLAAAERRALRVGVVP
jgi:putative phosphonate catabolism associated alcohol dehydrogenase